MTALRDVPRRLADRLRAPRTTVRWRLTLLYGSLFLVSGAALLAITYTLVDHATLSGPSNIQRGLVFSVPAGKASGPSLRRVGSAAAIGPVVPTGQAKSSVVPASATALGRHPLATEVPPAVKRALQSSGGRQVLRTVGADERITDLHQLVIESAIALAIMAVISTLLGWLVAGRVLRPVRTMTAATQQISEANLHERLAMQGPRDELSSLADTIDGLLGRLEGAFDAQRRFVANASHELRTPLTAARALLEMVITDHGATVQTFRETCRQVLEEGERQEELIDALLALAQGQRGVDKREPIDLAAVVAEALATQELEAAARGLRVEAALSPGPIAGDRRLVERLVSNLLENAVRHNRTDGWLRVVVDAEGDRTTNLTVANTGPPIAADQIERLLQPFQRLATDRVGHREGLGLGLSIVAAIANAHDAQLDVRPGPDGGLEVQVRFARAPDLEMAPGREQPQSLLART